MFKRISVLFVILGTFLGIQIGQGVAAIVVDRFTIPFTVHTHIEFSNVKYDTFQVTFIGRNGERKVMTNKGAEGAELHLNPKMDDVVQIIISDQFTVEKYSWFFRIYEGKATESLQEVSILESFSNEQEIPVKLLNEKGEEGGNGFYQLVIEKGTFELKSIQMHSWGRDMGNLIYRK